MTPTLGNFFPDEEIEKHAKAILTKGAVLRLFSCDIRVPKTKRLIIIGCAAPDGRLGKVYVNSAPQAVDDQLYLANTGREYLDRDSYVDCSRIYEDEYDVVLSAIKRDLGCHIGTVSMEDLQAITEQFQICRTIPKKQKIRFGILPSE